MYFIQQAALGMGSNPQHVEHPGVTIFLRMGQVEVQPALHQQ